MNKPHINSLFLIIIFILTGCSWFESEKERVVTERYFVEFEFDGEIPYLPACGGTKTVKYKVSKCFKDGEEINKELCSHIHKDPLILKSPEGYSYDSFYYNWVPAGTKSFFCKEGETRTEFELTCYNLDRFEEYSLNNNGVMDSCMPYPISIEHNIITNSVGFIYEIKDLENYKIQKINFPIVVKSSYGIGGICGYTTSNTVICQHKNFSGVDVGSNVAFDELNRGIKIKKFVYEGNTICVLYEDGEVGCTQGKPYDNFIGTNGAAGRGVETHVAGTNKVLFERTSPLIPEYFGAKDIVLLYSNNKQVSCALFEDESIKCSGQIGYLSGNNNITQVNIPITSYNKPIDSSSTTFKTSKCPFSQIEGDDCFNLNINTGNVGFVNKDLNQIGENEFVVGFIKNYFVSENMKDLYISSLGYLYKYSHSIGFERYHDLKIEQISYDGRYILSNREIYYNQPIPIFIKRY